MADDRGSPRRPSRSPGSTSRPRHRPQRPVSGWSAPGVCVGARSAGREAAAVTKLGNDAMDLVIRNLRVAGRRDVVRLARQLARTEDKLERVLQELEEVRDHLRDRDERAPGARSSRASRRAGATGNGAPGGFPPNVAGSPAEPAGAAAVRRRAPRAMSALDTLSRLPRASVEFANVILTTPDAAIGRPPATSCGRTARRRCTAIAAHAARIRCRCCWCSR